MTKHEVMIQCTNGVIMVLCECGYSYQTYGQVSWESLEQIVKDHLEASR